MQTLEVLLDWMMKKQPQENQTNWTRYRTKRILQKIPEQRERANEAYEREHGDD